MAKAPACKAATHRVNIGGSIPSPSTERTVVACWIGKHDLGRHSTQCLPRKTDSRPRGPCYSVPLFPGTVPAGSIEMFRRCGWRIRTTK